MATNWTTGAQTIWLNWNATTTTATIVTDCWPSWFMDSIAVSYGNAATSVAVLLQPPTAEQSATRRRLVEEARRKCTEANRRARELLLAHLDEQQRSELERENRFHLIVGERTYRVRRGRQGNIDLIEQGRPTRRYCIHPAEFLPDYDNLLAQKLLLETDEQEFLRIANETWLAA